MKICNKTWDLGYQALLDISQLPSLANRQTHLKLCTLFKIINGFWGDFPPNPIVPTVGRGRHNSPHSLQCPYARTTTFQSSFVPSSITLWNSLPIEALSANSAQSFKLLTLPPQSQKYFNCVGMTSPHSQTCVGLNDFSPQPNMFQ